MNQRIGVTLTSLLIALGVVVVITLGVWKVAAVADDRAASEKALRDADMEWSKAASARDLEKTLSYYSDDATVLPPNAPLITSKEAIRREWANMLAGDLNWQPTKIDLSHVGDLGYIIGTYSGTWTNAGKKVTDHGKYLEVWKKQADGKWKCVADMYSSDLPVASSQ